MPTFFSKGFSQFLLIPKSWRYDYVCNTIWFGAIISAWKFHKTTKCKANKRTEGLNHLCVKTRPIRNPSCMIIIKYIMTILNGREDYNIALENLTGKKMVIVCKELNGIREYITSFIMQC